MKYYYGGKVPASLHDQKFPMIISLHKEGVSIEYDDPKGDELIAADDLSLEEAEEVLNDLKARKIAGDSANAVLYKLRENGKAYRFVTGNLSFVGLKRVLDK